MDTSRELDSWAHHRLARDVGDASRDSLEQAWFDLGEELDPYGGEYPETDDESEWEEIPDDDDEELYDDATESS